MSTLECIWAATDAQYRSCPSEPTCLAWHEVAEEVAALPAAAAAVVAVVEVMVAGGMVAAAVDTEVGLGVAPMHQELATAVALGVEEAGEVMRHIE